MILFSFDIASIACALLCGSIWPVSILQVSRAILPVLLMLMCWFSFICWDVHYCVVDCIAVVSLISWYVYCCVVDCFAVVHSCSAARLIVIACVVSPRWLYVASWLFTPVIFEWSLSVTLSSFMVLLFLSVNTITLCFLHAMYMFDLEPTSVVYL